jgi:hypothetical protein
MDPMPSDFVDCNNNTGRVKRFGQVSQEKSIQGSGLPRFTLVGYPFKQLLELV